MPSYQGAILPDQRARRAKDEQVYWFELGELLVVCPHTDARGGGVARTRLPTKHMKSSKLANIADVIAALNCREQRESLCWICRRCSELVVSDHPTPAVCMFCGGGTFKKP